MRRVLHLIVLAAVCAGWACGCGPARKSTAVEFTVTTKPSGARVYVDGEPRGDSPTKVKLRYNFIPEAPFEGVARHFIYVEKDGYQPASREVRVADPSNVFFILERP